MAVVPAAAKTLSSMAAAAAPYATIAGGVISAAGALSGGAAASEQANYQAQLYDQQAQQREAQAKQDALDYQNREARILHSQRAAMGASGVDFTGTALDVSSDTAAQIAYNAAKIRTGGQSEAQALNEQANLTRYAGNAAQSGSYLTAAGDLFRGASILGTKQSFG